MANNVNVGLTNIIHEQSARNVELIVEAADANRKLQQAVADAKGKATRQRILAQAPIQSGVNVGVLQESERRHAEQITALGATMDKMNEEIKLKDELILDWTRSNESFKRLAQKYAKDQGFSSEQFEGDLKVEQGVVDKEMPKPEKNLAEQRALRTQSKAEYVQEQLRIKEAKQAERLNAVKEAVAASQPLAKAKTNIFKRFFG